VWLLFAVLLAGSAAAGEGPGAHARVEAAMKRASPPPQDLDPRRLATALAAIDRGRPLPERLDAASGAFLGAPYLRNPLIGSAETPEVFTVSLRGFDCVTFAETALALAHARTPDEFVDRVRLLRYEDGAVEWRARNHFMTDWVKRNARRGLVREIELDGTVSRRRTLNTVPGLPPRPVQVHCVPKRKLYRERDRIQTGDLLLFASTRSNRDVFHLGLAIVRGDRVMLRHASRSRKRVLDQDLLEFLNGNGMSGVIVVRPLATDAPAR
jgi:hypothetical protein